MEVDSEAIIYQTSTTVAQMVFSSFPLFTTSKLLLIFLDSI